MGCQFSWWNRDITCKLYTCIWKYACMYKVGNGCSRASVASLSQHIFIFTGIWIVASVIIRVKRWNVQWHPKHMHLSDNYVTTLNKKFFIVILEFNLEVLPCGILKMMYQCQFYVYTEEESFVCWHCGLFAMNIPRRFHYQPSITQFCCQLVKPESGWIRLESTSSWFNLWWSKINRLSEVKPTLPLASQQRRT